MNQARPKILVACGTRPEAVKLAPVVAALQEHHRSTAPVLYCWPIKLPGEPAPQPARPIFTPEEDVAGVNSTAVIAPTDRDLPAATEAFLRQVTVALAEVARRVLARIQQRLFEAWQEGRTVFVMGNGGSASTASHFAANLAKYTIAGDQPRFKRLLCQHAAWPSPTTRRAWPQ